MQVFFPKTSHGLSLTTLPLRSDKCATEKHILLSGFPISAEYFWNFVRLTLPEWLSGHLLD